MPYVGEGVGRGEKGCAALGIVLCVLLALGTALPVRAGDDGFTIEGSFAKSTTFYNGSVFIGDGNDSLFVDRHVYGIMGVDKTYTLAVDSTTHSVRFDLRTGLLLSGTEPARFTVMGGNVGFGTEAPESRLHVVGLVVAKDKTDGGVLRITDGSAQEMVLDGNQIETTEDPLYLNARTTNGVIIAPKGGNVGIATSSPSCALDVSGAGRFTGGLTVGAYQLPTAIGSPGQVLGVSAVGATGWIDAAQTGCWSLAGNTGSGHFLGTNDNQPLELRVDGRRVMRFEPAASEPHLVAPNIIAGYQGNLVGAEAYGATVAGGGMRDHENRALGPFCTVAGGSGNQAGGNPSAEDAAVVSGGLLNAASGQYSVVAGGSSNTASGWQSTVVGGAFNTASGKGSAAAGTGAVAVADGTFVWADYYPNGGGDLLPFAATTTNEFAIRATGGVRLVTAVDSATGTPTSGAVLAAGAGAWSALSDRALKANVASVDSFSVLVRLSNVPVTEWNMTAQDPSIRHVGPMAQDFYQAFGLGESERYINSSDADGIALVAIQALYTLNLEKDERISELEQQLAALDARLAALEEAVGRLSP